MTEILVRHVCCGLWFVQRLWKRECVEVKDFVVIAHVLGRCAFWESVQQAVVRWKSVRGAGGDGV